jgi:hypothetical protein
MTRHKRLGVSMPFTYSQSTTDALGWRTPKEASPLTISKLGAALAASDVPAKLDEVVAALKAREQEAERAKIEKLREHIRTFPLPPPEVRKALHLRSPDPGMDKFLELVAKSGKRIGKK